jgi:hypothetical protein
MACADATALAVCDKRRISRHRALGVGAGQHLDGLVLRLKPHAIINFKGQLLRPKLTPGNADDRKPMRRRRLAF